ncbi:hypothetical protein GC176_24275, partial [bacterium]|nr:hypothetical protein [bacterium]
MQNSIWKLTALAGVIGLGFLIVLQMQGEIGQNQQAQNEAAAPPASDNSHSDGKKTALTEPPPIDQWEPDATTPAFGSGPLVEPGFPATASSDLTSDPFAEPPAFLSEPATEPLATAPPEKLPLLADNPDFNATSRRLPGIEEPGPFQLMSSEELADPFESADAPASPLPEPTASLPEPDQPGNLTKADTPIGLFESAPELTSEPAVDSLLPEPEVSAPPLGELALPDVSQPEPLPTLDLPEIDTAAPPVTGLFDSELATEKPLPELPKVADETYLVEPELSSDSLPLTSAEPESLLLPAEQPTATGTLPELEPAPPNPAPAELEASPVLTSSTGKVVTELTGDAELPAELPASAQQPELTIEKVAPKEATLGKPMIYSIIVSNRGVTNAAQVIVEDQVPKGCRLVGTIPQAELIGSKLLWRLGHLAAGAKKKILVKVIPVEEGQVGSIATVNFVAEVAARTDVRSTPAAQLEPPTAGTPAETSPAVSVKPIASPQPKIELSVVGPDKAQVGDTVVLKFNIANNGGLPAKDVALQDIIPVGFEHPAGNDLTYEVGALDPGKSVNVELELVAVKPGAHTNQAVITAAGNLRTESKKKVEILDARGLTLQVEASAAKPIGQPGSLMLRVTNESSQPVSGATLAAVLPQKSHFGSATENGHFDKTTRTVKWALPSIAAGATATLMTQLTPLDFGTQSVTATLTQSGHEAQSAEATFDVLGVAALKVEIDNVPPTASVGEEFHIDVTVTNKGNGADRAVKLALLLPPELEFVNSRGPVKHEIAQAEAAGKRIPFTMIPEIGEQ